MRIHISLILYRKYNQRENICLSPGIIIEGTNFFSRLSPHPKIGSSLSDYNAPSDNLKWPNVE